MELDQYRDKTRSMRVKALLWLVVGLPVASIGGAALVLGVLIAVFPATVEPGEYGWAVGAMAGGGVVVTGIGLGPCLMGLRGLLKLRQLRLDTARQRLAADQRL